MSRIGDEPDAGRAVNGSGGGGSGDRGPLTGGAATGGASTATGGSGASPDGGTAGAATGGSSGGQCTPEDPGLSGCDACIHEHCCAELWACNEDQVCGGAGGELRCLIDCVDAVWEEMRVVTVDDVLTCAAQCAHSIDEIVATTTDALVSCINTPVNEDSSERLCAPHCLHLVF